MRRTYTGHVEEYVISSRMNRPYNDHRVRNGKLDQLHPITTTLIQLDRESQVECVRDATGAVTSMRIQWNDGWDDTVRKTTWRTGGRYRAPGESRATDAPVAPVAARSWCRTERS